MALSSIWPCHGDASNETDSRFLPLEKNLSNVGSEVSYESSSIEQQYYLRGRLRPIVIPFSITGKSVA